MIPAAKSSWFERLFAVYNERYLFKRHFHSVKVRGEVDALPAGRPVVYVMNHSSWWDGLLVFAVIRRSLGSHYMMMDEKQMRQFKFFRWIGAFSVDKTTVRGMAESLRYAELLLKQGKSVWLFPQGDIRHLEERPLSFQGGAGYLLARVPEAAVIPVTAYYTLGGRQKAEAGVWFGEALLPDELAGLRRNEITSLLAERVEKQLDTHRTLAIQAVRDGAMEGFAPIWGASRSTDERFTDMKRRAGKWLSYFGR